MGHWRKRLFWLLVAAFAVGAPLVLFYALGYRFDFTTGRVELTGSIVLKTTPTEANVFIDGTLEKQTSFLTGTALLRNRLAGTITMRVEKDGYFPWEKKVEVKKQETTVFPAIALFKKEPGTEVLLTFSSPFSPTQSPSENLLLAEKTGKTVSIQNIGNEKTTVGTPWTTLPQKLFISLDGKNVIGIFGLTYWEVLSVEEDSTQRLFTSAQLKKKLQADDLFWVGRSSPQLFLRNGKMLYRINFPQGTATAIADAVLAAAPSGEEILLLTSSGRLRFIAQDGSDVGPDLNQKLFFGTKTPGGVLDQYGGGITFLDPEKHLYFLDPDTGAFEKIGQNVQGSLFAPRGNKILLWTKNEIWIYWYQEEKIGYLREKGRKELVARFSQPFAKAFWIKDDNYVLVAFPEKIMAIEVDSRDKRNLYTLDTENIKDVFISSDQNNIFVVGEKTIRQKEL